MMDLLTPFRSFIKYKEVYPDNSVFRLHYKVTVIMLLIFTLMVTSKQFFGEPIHCISGSGKSNDDEAINSYCWIYGKYTLKSLLTGIEGKQVAYPGVGHGVDDDQLKHTYYQWICFILLGQAMLFYIPHFLWKSWEEGRLRILTANLTNPIVSTEVAKQCRKQLMCYFSDNSYTHNMYALRFAFCEVLNFCNTIGQIFLLDIFLGGSFRNYGTAVATFTRAPRLPDEITNSVPVNPMDQYFPKLTKCWFRSYGPSGTIQLKDRLCVLPLNIINEKIFIVLWFWLIILAVLSAMTVVYRILLFSLPSLRVYMLMGNLRDIKKKTVSKIVRKMTFGEWFLLYLLGNNMNQIVYKDLVEELSKDDKHCNTSLTV